MININQILEKKVDKFILLLVFFAFLLIALFFYLLKIETNIKNYSSYHQKLERMISLDYQLDNFFLKAYRYVDYDAQIETSRKFENNLNFLKKSSIQTEFDIHIYKDIKNVEEEYRYKISLLERFKTLNARVTNSIHYLYDLRKTISTIHTTKNKEEGILDEILFKIGQSLMDIPLDQTQFLKDIDKLIPYTTEHDEFLYFYQQSKQFSLDILIMKNILAQNKELKVTDSIHHVTRHLEKMYVSNRSQYKGITFSFFILAFLILIILMFNYKRVVKNTRELLAFKYAIENSDNSIVITDRERKMEYVNDTFEKNTGYSKAEVLGKNPNILKSNLLSPEFYKNMNEILDRGDKWQGELINKRKDGTLLYEKTSIVPVILEDEVIQYLAIKLDISDYIEQQKRLKQSSVVYEMTADGIIITDNEKKILSVNTAFVSMFGYEERELLGQEPMIIDAIKEDKVFYEKMWHKLLEQNRWSGKVYNKTKSGKILPIWLTITIVRDKEDAIQNYIAIYTNLQEIIEMEEKVNFLAYHDNLTKLPNRVYFERDIVDIFELAKNKETKVAILFMDLDRFKVINDTLGHHIGDAILIQISQRIKKVLNKDNLFVRMGGDEFIIVIDNLEKREDAVEVAEKILSLVRDPMNVMNYHLHTTASIGIAIFPDDGTERAEILKHADSAMYDAKDKGKDNYQFYTKKLSTEVETRLNLEQELLQALERDEFSLCYQPQYELISGKIIGAEALLRWNNPNLGIISPDHFIPVAEETGVIVKIGYYVFEEACRTYMYWKEQGVDIQRISINLSSVQLQQDNIYEQLIEIIHKVGISPSNIEIEITERLIMNDSIKNLLVLEALRKEGCKISIDDFGTGYSSMSYMKSFPLDTIKIDKSFIMDLPDDGHDAEVSKAIIALSKSLGYEVIAEGIETFEQEKFLIEHHCDIGQGYYFAKPMTRDKFTSFYHQKKQ